jgi:hypothetical protein
MHFIETSLGFSPDAGTGATELLYLIVFATAFLVLFGRKRIRRFGDQRRTHR